MTFLIFLATFAILAQLSPGRTYLHLPLVLAGFMGGADFFLFFYPDASFLAAYTWGLCSAATSHLSLANYRKV